MGRAKPVAVAMSAFGSPNGFDMSVFLYFVVNGYKRSVEMPCQGNNHSICRIFMKLTRQPGGLHGQIIINWYKTKSLYFRRRI